MDATSGDDPIRVHGSRYSYFTGKLEAYLRYKEIPYSFLSITPTSFRRTIPANTGATQIPAVELPDGRWMTDTTPIIRWFEGQYPTPIVIPKDPLQRFFSALLEDYADEWLWRPAMHYRWSHPGDRQLLRRLLVDELLRESRLPKFVYRRLLARRQFSGFVRGDGVDKETREHVEAGYFVALDCLQAILSKQDYLLGDLPSLADFGFCGPMLRHFSHDPTPADIMVERAPAVWAWVARLWNVRASRCDGSLTEGVPDAWGPILDEIGETHLEQLSANADAWKRDRVDFSVTIQGTRYHDVPTSGYRVWCLEELRRGYEALPEPAREEAHAILEKHGCWGPLWRSENPCSGHDLDGTAPFGRGLRVYPLKR